MSELMQIVILIMITICLIFYFFDILGVDEYNYQDVESNDELNKFKGEGVKDVKVLDDEEYLLGMLNSIKNFNENDFKGKVCKVLEIIFEKVKKQEFGGLDILMTLDMLKEIKNDYSTGQTKIKILLIRGDRSRNSLLNDLFFSKEVIQLRFVRFVDVKVDGSSVDIIVECCLNDHLFIFTFNRSHEEDKVWLWKSVS